jgi:hypothetical protein
MSQCTSSGRLCENAVFSGAATDGTVSLRGAGLDRLGMTLVATFSIQSAQWYWYQFAPESTLEISLKVLNIPFRREKVQV